ncbi:leucine-rich repeat, immunoglobulin-like domain and transmembrane domain-containing protein 3b [Conger conger]|uniref:leucine-rich repeat, immunoglobulin-like domain and transmembrane domain-containing protein 3b n=1 Tax=Conger conger TaxID=82655 RepID=UPI002A599E75|nr:leucine-rich repeat, immunoglobulin-like domain and transmembrane domain-containing protein 3b [Conger conger]
MYHILYVLLCCLRVVHCFCPSQCTCTFHGRSDGTGSRSVLCNDPDMSDIPTNVPVDTVKLRVEKTAIRRIPTEAFYYLAELRYLWLTYNSVTTVDAGSFYNLKGLHELRLDGNVLALFPWESLRETPSLRTLDLHNNRLTNVPAEAASYLRNVTYLDLSSNKLVTLPSDLMDIWPPFSGVPWSANLSQRVVLGVQDNPWFCDCRISKLLELSKMSGGTVVLLDQLLVCSGPENLAGVPFQLAELDQCLKPSVMTSATKITSPLGSNVLLRCDATGYPTPTLFWSRADAPLINSTVVEETPGEGTRWSILSLNGVLSRDAGDYRCKAKNVAGVAEASVTLSVAGVVTVAPPLRPTVSLQPDGGGEEPGVGTTDSTVVTTAFTAATQPAVATPTPAANPPTTTLPPPVLPTKQGQQRALTQTGRPPQSQAGRRPDSKSTTPTKPTPPIRGIRVTEETAESAVLLWETDAAWGDAQLTVVYSPYEGKDKQTASAPASSGRLLLSSLRPRMKYMACLIARNGPSRKDQCVTFTTLEGEERPNLALLVISGLACSLALPVIGFLLYKITRLFCQKSSSPTNHDQDTYVKFETLSLKQRTVGNAGNDLWTRRQTQESERMLLFSRSSIDSQMTYKSDSSRSEYLC